MQSKISIITLGVKDLNKAIQFYRDIAFFELQGTWLALYPLEELVKDIGGEVLPAKPGFAGMTLAHNLSSKAEVDLAMKEAKQAGATIAKPAQDAFWGGYSGYFTDPDGYYWEIAWNPFLQI